jgi:NlpC/P60 family putative phage cell wall peptidase
VTSRTAIVATARGWLGTPWQHQAYIKGVATDCIGLVAGVALELRLPGAEEWRDNPQFHNYARTPNVDFLIAGCEQLLEPVPRSAVQPGDILVLKFRHEPQHFAIVTRLDPMYMIHALARAKNAGKVVENRVDEVWAKRVVRTYRYRGVDG